MANELPAVPAVPSVVLALGASLHGRLAWLERRFRSEIGALYPANLLRFRLLTQAEQLTPEALHALCDPLLVHPLWLKLQERGLAPAGEHGPALNAYLILAQEDARGRQLLAPLCANLRRAYAGRLEPSLCLFYVGTDPWALPPLPDAPRPSPCFVLGPVKQLGYGTTGGQEPFETIRLALNALLASPVAGEVENLLAPDQPPGLVPFALGASAIAVARPQMETWLRNTLLVRLARACGAGADAATVGEGGRAPARRQVAELFGLESVDDWEGEPDGLWEKGLGWRIAGLFPRWANEVLGAWGLEVQEARLGHWRLSAERGGDLYRRLQHTLSGPGEAQEDAQLALTQEIVRLAQVLQRHLDARAQAVLERWSALVASTAAGSQSLPQMAAVLAAAQSGLAQARDRLAGQRLRPLWLRGDRDTATLADILAAQMMPVRSAAERARLAFVSPGIVALRLLPLALLLGATGADLQRGWPGPAAGLAGGIAFAALAAGLQYRRLRHESYTGLRELCRLYEDAVGGLLVAEAQGVLRRWQEAVAVSEAQLGAVQSELRTLEAEAGRALDRLARFPRENTYLERQLSDPAHCARLADEVSLEALLNEPLDHGPAPATPARLLADALRGDLPAAALGASLVEAVGRAVARRSGRMIETRVEELLVAGTDRPFQPAETMGGLHRRALPLWHGDEEALGPELALVSISREAAMAVRAWLNAQGERVRLLPTLQRDRISYLRCRHIRPANDEKEVAGESV